MSAMTLHSHPRPDRGSIKKTTKSLYREWSTIIVNREKQGCALSCNALTLRYVSTYDRLHMTFPILKFARIHGFKAVNPHKYRYFQEITPKKSYYLDCLLHFRRLFSTSSTKSPKFTFVIISISETYSRYRLPRFLTYFSNVASSILPP